MADSKEPEHVTVTFRITQFFHPALTFFYSFWLYRSLQVSKIEALTTTRAVRCDGLQVWVLLYPSSRPKDKAEQPSALGCFQSSGLVDSRISENPQLPSPEAIENALHAAKFQKTGCLLKKHKSIAYRMTVIRNKKFSTTSTKCQTTQSKFGK